MKAMHALRTILHTMAGAFVATQLAGCPDQATTLVVTVAARPAVIGAESLKIKIAVDGVGSDKTYTITDKTFPQTFSVSTTSLASGNISITAEATAGGELIGFGKLDTSFTATDPELMLEAADFVVHDVVLGDQELVSDYEAVGYQLASFPNGDWDVGFRTPNNTEYAQNGRRFTITSDTVVTEAAAADTPWSFTTAPTKSESAIAVANNTRRTLAAWDISNGVLATSGIMCRSISAAGALNAAPVLVSTDGQPDVVTLAPLPNGNFVIAWRGTPTIGGSLLIRALIVDENCTEVVPTFAVSTLAAATISRPTVAARSGGILFAWRAGDDFRYRRFTISGSAATADDTLFAKISDPNITTNDFVRLAPFGAGFAAVFNQSMTGAPGATRLVLQKLSVGGVKDGPLSVIAADIKTPDSEAMGLFSTGDMDPLMVTWRGCTDSTDFNCGEIYGRLLRPTGQPMGEAFVVNTTTTGLQDTPSVTRLGPAGDAPVYAFAWNDDSHADPDTSGSAVRARIVYPAYNNASGTLGADCRTGKALCTDGLVCIGDSENVPRCVPTCNPTGPAPLCPLGGSCTKQGEVAGCRF